MPGDSLNGWFSPSPPRFTAVTDARHDSAAGVPRGIRHSAGMPFDRLLMSPTSRRTAELIPSNDGYRYNFLRALRVRRLPLVLLIGCFVGTIVGLLPGLGPINGVASTAAFALHLLAESALLLLATVYIAVSMAAGFLILLNVPGDAARRS